MRTPALLRIGPVQDRLIRGDPATPYGLYHLHRATARQLCTLHYKAGALTTVQAHCKKLADAGYFQADTVPTRHPGNPYFYTLGTKGLRYLQELGVDVSESLRASRETGQHALFLAHALELNDVIISAILLGRRTPEMALLAFKGERDLRSNPYKLVWNGRQLVVLPDALLRFRIGELQRAVLIEHDRGTEGRKHFRRRVRGLIEYLKREPVPVAFTTFTGLPSRRRPYASALAGPPPTRWCAAAS